VPLPDEAARNAILDIHLTRRGHTTKIPITELVRRTEGFAGREVEQLCLIAINAMIRRANPSLLKMVDKGLTSISEYELKVQPIAEEDFAQGFAQIRPVSDQLLLTRYERWQNHVIKSAEAD